MCVCVCVSVCVCVCDQQLHPPPHIELLFSRPDIDLPQKQPTSQIYQINKNKCSPIRTPPLRPLREDTLPHPPLWMQWYVPSLQSCCRRTPSTVTTRESPEITFSSSSHLCRGLLSGSSYTESGLHRGGWPCFLPATNTGGRILAFLRPLVDVCSRGGAAVR